LKDALKIGDNLLTNAACAVFEDINADADINTTSVDAENEVLEDIIFVWY
jgi:hypothetical protein